MAERWQDMLAIGQILARYCRGIDRLDAELLASTFWPDSFDSHGLFEGGREGFIAWVIPAMQNHYALTQYSLGQSYYEFRDDQAAVETHFTGKGWGLGGQRDLFGMLCGRYADLFEKRAGEWRILRRTVIYDGSATCQSTDLGFNHIAGVRSEDDVSYHIFEAVSGH